MSSEYGWTDEQIGELSLARLIQITSAIKIRQFYEDRKRKSELSWQVRTMALFIAQGYMVSGENPGIKHALSLSIDDIDAALIEDAKTRTASTPKVIDPPVGSYERAIRAFGGKLSGGPPPN